MHRPGRWKIVASFACAALVVVFPSMGQGDEPPSATSLPASMELSRLLDLASQRLGVRVEYVPSQLTGTATLRGSVTDDELWDIVNLRLNDAGFASVRTGIDNHFRVVRLDPSLATGIPIEALKPVAPAPTIDWPAGPRPGYVAVMIEARHKPARELVEPLRGLLSKAGSVSVVAGTESRVVIADVTPRVEQALATLALIDAPSEAAVLEEIEVRNAPAAQIVQAAREFVTKRDAVAAGAGAASGRSSGELIAAPGGRVVMVIAPRPMLPFWRDLIARLDAHRSADTREYPIRAFAAKDVAVIVTELLGADGDGTARIVTDDLTGTLIVTASTDQHDRVAGLMTRLAATPAVAASRLRSFPVRHRPAKDVADSLNVLLGAGPIDIDLGGPSRSAMAVAPPPNPADPVRTTDRRVSRETNGNASDRQSTDAERAERPEVTITVDEGLNTLVVVGEPRMLAQIEELLKTLDVRQPQVMIEVTLVSLTEGQSRALGVELQKFGSLAGSAIQLSSLFGSAATGTPPQIAGAPGSGFTGAALNPGDFNAVIRALERVNAGRSSSTPRVLVANNQDASFKSVAQQPTSNTSTNTSSTTITSFGGFQDAGTSIRVKPQIADGDRLTLDYSVELSSFTGQPTAGLPSARQQNSVASVAQIPDGFTVVVGGFELETESEDVSQVPLLGDIPGIGELFKSRTTTDDRTRFFVFIRASIMRGGGFEELKHISVRDSGSAGVAEGWPEVEPLAVR